MRDSGFLDFTTIVINTMVITIIVITTITIATMVNAIMVNPIMVNAITLLLLPPCHLVERTGRTQPGVHRGANAYYCHHDKMTMQHMIFSKVARNDKYITVGVAVNGATFYGGAANKKDARTVAAFNALEFLFNITCPNK